jgi:Raf kinase inhibitor-like YbhB/YbcL family protein
MKKASLLLIVGLVALSGCYRTVRTSTHTESTNDNGSAVQTTQTTRIGTDQAAMDKMKVKSQEAMQATTAYLNLEKDRLGQELGQTKDKLDQKIAELKQQATQAKDGAKERLTHRIIDLEAAQAHLDTLKTQAGAASQDVLQKVKTDWNQLHADIETQLDTTGKNVTAFTKGGLTMPSVQTELRLSSPAFEPNSAIPAQYTCNGRDSNPPLDVAGIPKGTHSLALTVHDPDAPGGNWDHWVVWNIPPQTTRIDAGHAPKASVQGATSFKHAGYGGPCPPSGTHHYNFRLYALDTTLNLPTSTHRKALEDAMKGHILSQSELVGIYSHR